MALKYCHFPLEVQSAQTVQLAHERQRHGMIDQIVAADPGTRHGQRMAVPTAGSSARKLPWDRSPSLASFVLADKLRMEPNFPNVVSGSLMLAIHVEAQL